MKVYSGADYGSILIMDQEEFTKLQELVTELHNAESNDERGLFDIDFVFRLRQAVEGEGRSPTL